MIRIPTLVAVAIIFSAVMAPLAMASVASVSGAAARAAVIDARDAASRTLEMRPYGAKAFAAVPGRS